MGGKKISKVLKEILIDHFKHGTSAKKLFNKIFLGNKKIISLSHIKTLYRKFANYKDDVEFDEYLNKELSIEMNNIINHGRKKSVRFSKAAINKINFLAYEKRHRNEFLTDVVHDFNKLFYGDNYDPHVQGLKLTTCQRWVKEAKVSLKVGEKRNIRRSKLQAYHLMRLVEHYRKEQFVSSDGMCSADKYMCKSKGRAPTNERAYLPQFKIGKRTFSLYASACSRGILCWKIFEDAPVNGNDIYVYLRENLAPCLENQHVGIFDNAKVHKKDICVIEMERIFAGKYVFCSPYSPHLNPIERVFSLIRNYLKSNEEYARLNPVEAINAACLKYSVNGPEGDTCSKFFDLYERNYELAHI